MTILTYPLLNGPLDASQPVVACDLEGTLTSGVTVMAMHRYLELHGQRRASRSLYRRLMTGYVLRRLIGKDLREYKNTWMRALVRMFAGWSLQELRHMTDWVVRQSIWAQRREAVVAELEAHRAAGRRVVIVSGMFIPMLESLLVYLPEMEAIGTTIVGQEEPFSGELAREFNVGPKKVENLRMFADPDGMIFGAYGDTYSDLPMLAMSRHPVAVAPDRKLLREARARGWRVLDA